MGGARTQDQAGPVRPTGSRSTSSSTLLQAPAQAQPLQIAQEPLRLREGPARADQPATVNRHGRSARDAPIQIREVLFVDTSDFRLYNNAFILRRRILYEDGFPVGDPEIVFKFRSNDIQKAAETDVRPHILGDHRVKFKCQALPLKERARRHPRSTPTTCSSRGPTWATHDVLSMGTMAKIFPVLERIKKEPDEKSQLVSDTIIEEVLQDIGTLDFGEGITAKVNIALWRTRGEHRPLIGEFAFQIKLKDRAAMPREAMIRVEKFFLALQFAAKDWISLTATKTGSVYGFYANPPKSAE